MSNGSPAASLDGAIFRAALEATPVGVVICDVAGRILFINQQITRIFQTTAVDLTGRALDNLIPHAMGGGEDLVGRREDGSPVPVEVAVTAAEWHGDPILIASVVDLSERRAREREVRHELARLRDRLAAENWNLRTEVKALRAPSVIVAKSAASIRALAEIEPVAPTNATVLLTGETGSGKEVFAQAIHEMSPRHHRPMVRVNCAGIPSALIESELFGRERGAYTGALSKQIGRFELADGSTIFLDEIGDLPLESQVKLLRVLQDRVIERLGSNQPIKVDVRIIAATNSDLERAVQDKSFRADLYYRLNVYPVTIPPLRERREDISALVWTFVDEFAKAFGKRIESISKESLAALQEYPWPGNVRELRNLAERSVIVSSGPRLTLDVPRRLSAPTTSGITNLRELETKHIRDVLETVGWRVRGTGGAAERLGMKPTTLESRMGKLGIRRAR